MCFFAFFLTGLSLAGRIIQLPDLTNPDSVKVEKDRVYITDGVSVYIFSISPTDYKLLKRFGKAGEGPQEFRVPPRVSSTKLQLSVQSDQLVINSMNRVSFFSKAGDYINQIHAPSGVNFIPLGAGYAAYSSYTDEKVVYLTINLYNPSLNKIKTVFQKEFYVQANKDFNLIKLGCGNRRRAVYEIYKNMLFIEGANDVIHVFDEKGSKIRDIKLDYVKLPIPENRKETIGKELDLLFTGRFMRQLIREKGYFPKSFPARIFTVSDGKIYIPTYRKKDKKNEFTLYSIEGKRLKKTYLPFKDQYFLMPYPYTIGNGQIYQLFDNDDDETWELHIHKVL